VRDEPPEGLSGGHDVCAGRELTRLRDHLTDLDARDRGVVVLLLVLDAGNGVRLDL
jgi:hypothetical protein